jgi:non-ribosomal peptide synthetase component F
MPESEAGTGILLVYNPDLFDVTTIGRLLGHYRTLPGRSGDPQRPISSLPLLTEAERHQLAARQSRCPGHRSLHTTEGMLRILPLRLKGWRALRRPQSR